MLPALSPIPSAFRIKATFTTVRLSALCTVTSTATEPLNGLSSLLSHEQAFDLYSNWQGNMEHLSTKIGVWVKEMGWVEEAFIGGLRQFEL